MADFGAIELKNIKKSYDDDVILENFNLKINKGEFVTLLGPSGCGKTTTLRLIGGFETPDEGDILFDGKRINDVPPNKRPLNTVFQKYSLFTNMNIFENVAFGLKIKKLDKKTISEKVTSALSMVNLAGFEKRMPDSLSGGQQQRVAIARAIVNEPEVLLFDEPLGALDLKLRQEMQLELKKLQKSLGITFVYVTHDQEEALTMSDSIVVMSNGKIQQYGTPIDIYNEPINRFVARFIGESNIYDGVMNKDFEVSFLGKTFECVDKGFEIFEDIDVVIRPEDVKIAEAGMGARDAVVTSVIFKGVHYEMELDGGDFKMLVHNTLSYPEGKTVSVNFLPDDIHIMKKENVNG